MKKMNAKEVWSSKGERGKAFARDLKEALAAANASPELQGVAHGDERRVLVKLAALDNVLAAHHRPLRIILGKRSTTDIALDMIRHAGTKVTANIRAAVEDLAERHPHPSTAVRHSPEREIDRKIDAWEEKVLFRKRGAPRSVARPDRIDWSGTCVEIGCSVTELDEISERRIRQIDRMPPPDDPLRHIFGNKVKTDHNPAVAVLLRAGLSKFASGLPEDPFKAGGIDFITIARTCGVSPTDIFKCKEHYDIILAAKGDQPLMPHPCIAKRRFTYAYLREHGYGIRHAELSKGPSADAQSRRTTASLDAFMRLQNAKPGDLVPNDFERLVNKALAAGPSQFGSWWKKDMGRWLEYRNDLRARLPLPEDFALTLRMLIAESGVPVADVARGAGVPYSVINHYMRGLNVPSMQSQPVLERIAKIVAIPVEVMTRELAPEWRRNVLEIDDANYEAWMSRWLPSDLEALADLDLEDVIESLKLSHGVQNTVYARRHTEALKDRYQLKEYDWTESMTALWEAQYPDPKDLSERERRAARKPGAEMEEEDTGPLTGTQKRPPRPGTRNFKLNVIRSILGYFARSRMLTPAQLAQIDRLDESMMTDFRPESGLGIPRELLEPALLAIPDLISSFIWWRSDRAGAEGPYVLATLALVAQLLRPKTGEIWKDARGEMLDQLERFKKWWDENPHDLSEGDLKLEISAYRKDWQAAVEAAYMKVVQDMRNVRRRKPVSTRDPFLAISAAIKHPRPMERYMKGVYKMLGSKPIKTLARHIHVRDCVQMLILLQSGLRVGTMLFEWHDRKERRSAKNQLDDPNEMRIFKRADADGSVSWMIRIGHERFKNHYGEFFAGGQPFELTLLNEDHLYDLLEIYVQQSRPYLLKGRESTAFFVTHRYSDFDERDISRAHRTNVCRYFLDPPEFLADGSAAEEDGWMMSHGPHSVRHIIATHIVKTTGNIHYAAWSIHDSPLTVQKYYARFVPREKLAHAAVLLAEARAVARLDNEKAAEAAAAADKWRLAA